MFRFLLRLSLVLFFISCVFAYNTTVSDSDDDTSLEEIFNSTDVGESRRRKRWNKFPFGHHIWWWGLKALSVLVTVKIKLVLLVLFLGGGIFYGLKVWNGTALGCPEPIIQEVKHHDYHDILPYHGHDFISPDVYSSYPSYVPSYSGHYDGTAYSNTPPPSAAAGTYGVPFSSSSVTATGTDTSSPVSNTYLPPSNRRAGVKGRAIDAQSSDMVTDLVFRFLGVNTLECRKRFVCELEFRNPLVEQAMRYMGRDLLSEYRSEKENKAKKFTDCAVLHPNCTFPKRSVRIKKRNGVDEGKVENVESETKIPDVVAKYVKKS